MKKLPGIPPGLPAGLAEMDADDWLAFPEHQRRDLVAEAFHTFGEPAARELADELGVAFEACAEDIARLQHRPH